MSNDLEVVQECSSPEEAARVFLAVYDRNEFKVVGSNICVKAHGFSPHITRQYTEPGEPGPAPIEEPLTFQANTVSLVIGGKRTDYTMGNETKDVGTASPVGGPPLGFAPIQRGVGDEEDDEETKPHEGEIVVPAQRIPIEPRRVPRPQGKADAASGGTPVPSAPNDGRGDSSDVRSIPDERHHRLRLGAWENALANLLHQHFDRQERVVKAKLTGAKNRDRWERAVTEKPVEAKREQPGTVTPVIIKPPVEVGHVFDKETWKDALKADTSGMVRAIWDDFGQDAADTYGVDWTIDTPDIDSAIGTQLAGLLHVEDTTEDQISKALEKGFHHGDDVQTLSDRIGGVFDSARLLRAPMIAQQQTVAAGNGAIVNVGKQSDGEFTSKTWNTQGDEKVREWHNDADGQTVPIDAQFSVGPDMLDCPGDPAGSLENTINCRCWATLSPPTVTPWEPASAEERAAQDIVFGKSIPVFALSRSALRSPDVKVYLTKTALNSKAKLTPVFRTSVKDDGPYGIPQNASVGPIDDELTEGGIPLEEKDWNPDAHPRDEHGKFVSGAAVGGVVTGTGTKGKFTEDDLKPFIGRKLTITNSANDSQYSGILASISNPDDVAASKTNPMTLYVTMEGAGSITWPDGTEEAEPKMEALGHLPVGKDDMVHVEAEEPKVEDLTKTSLEDGSIKPTGADGKYQASDLKDRVGEPLTFINKDGEKITGKIFDAFEKDGQSYVEFAGGVGIDYADGTHEDDVDWGKMNLGNVREVMGKTIPQKMDEALQKLADATVGEVLNSKPEDEWPQEIADELSGKAPEGEKPLPTVTNPKDADMAQFTGKEVTITQASSYGAGQTYTGTQEPDPDSDKNSPMHPQFRLMGGANNGMYYTADELDSIGLAGAPSADDQLQSYQEQTAGAKPTTGQFIQASGANGYTPADLEPFVGQKLTFGTIGGVGTATGTLTGADYDDNGKGITTFEDVHWDYGNGDTQDSDFVNMLTSDMENVSVGGKPEGTPRPITAGKITPSGADGKYTATDLQPYAGKQVDLLDKDGSHIIGTLSNADAFGVFINDGVVHWGDGTTNNVSDYDGIHRSFGDIAEVTVRSQESAGAKPFSAGATILPNGSTFTDADVQPYIGKTVNVTIMGQTFTGTVTGAEYGNLTINNENGKSYIDPGDIQNGSATVTLTDQSSAPRVAAGTSIPLTGTKFTQDDIKPFIGKQVTVTYKNGEVIKGTITGKLDIVGAAVLSDVTSTEDGVTSNMSDWSVSPNGGATSFVVNGGPESSAQRLATGMVKPTGPDGVYVKDDLKPYAGKLVTVTAGDGHEYTGILKVATNAAIGVGVINNGKENAVPTIFTFFGAADETVSKVTLAEPSAPRPTGGMVKPTGIDPDNNKPVVTNDDLKPYVGKTITMAWVDSNGKTGTVVGKLTGVGMSEGAGAFMKFDGDGATVTWTDGSQGHEKEWSTEGGDTVTVGEPGTGAKPGPTPTGPGGTYTTSDLDPFVGKTITITSTSGVSVTGVVQGTDLNGYGGAAGAVMFEAGGTITFKNGETKPTVNGTQMPLGQSAATIALAGEPEGSKPTGNGYVLSTVKPISGDKYSSVDLNPLLNQPVKITTNYDNTYAGVLTAVTASGIATVFTGNADDPYQDIAASKIDTLETTVPAGSRQSTGIAQPFSGGLPVTPTGEGAEYTPDHYTVGDLQGSVGKQVSFVSPTGATVTGTFSNLTADHYGDPKIDINAATVTLQNGQVNTYVKLTYSGNELGQFAVTPGQTGGGAEQATGSKITATGNGGKYTAGDLKPYIGKVVTITDQDGSKMVVTLSDSYTSKSGQEYAGFSPSADQTWIDKDGKSTTVGGSEGSAGINLGSTASIEVTGASVGQPTAGPLKPSDKGGGGFTDADVAPYIGKTVTATYPDGSTVTGKLVNNAGGQTLYLSDVTKMSADGTPTTISNFYVTAADPKGIGSVNTGTPSSLTVEGAPVEGGRTGQPPSNMTGTGKFGNFTEADVAPYVGKTVTVTYPSGTTYTGVVAGVKDTGALTWDGPVSGTSNGKPAKVPYDGSKLTIYAPGVTGHPGNAPASIVAEGGAEPIAAAVQPEEAKPIGALHIGQPTPGDLKPLVGQKLVFASAKGGYYVGELTKVGTKFGYLNTLQGNKKVDLSEVTGVTSKITQDDLTPLIGKVITTTDAFGNTVTGKLNNIIAGGEKLSFGQAAEGGVAVLKDVKGFGPAAGPNGVEKGELTVPIDKTLATVHEGISPAAVIGLQAAGLTLAQPASGVIQKSGTDPFGNGEPQYTKADLQPHVGKDVTFTMKGGSTYSGKLDQVVSGVANSDDTYIYVTTQSGNQYSPELGDLSSVKLIGEPATVAAAPVAVEIPKTQADLENYIGKTVTITDKYKGGTKYTGTLAKISANPDGSLNDLNLTNVTSKYPDTDEEKHSATSIHDAQVGVAAGIMKIEAGDTLHGAAAAPVANNVAPNGKITPSGPGGKYQESDLKPHVGKPMVYLAGGVPKPGKIVSFGGDEDLRYAKILDTNTGSYVYPMLKNLGNVQLDAKPGTAAPVVAKLTASQPTGKKLSWGSTVPATGANGLHSVEDLKPYEGHAVTATLTGGAKFTGLVSDITPQSNGGATFKVGNHAWSTIQVAKLESGAQSDAMGYDKSKDPKATSSYTPPVNSYEPPPPVKPDYDKTKPSATPEQQTDGVDRKSAAVAKAAGFATSVTTLKNELSGKGMTPHQAQAAARGRSLIYDGTDVEDLDVRVAKVKDADGNDAYELKFKLMPDAMDKLKTAITKDGSNWGIGQMNVSRKEFQGDHFTNSAKGYIKEEGSTAYGTIDGADVKVHYISDSQKQKDAKAEVDPYASSSSFDTPYAYDRTVQVSIPAEQFTDKKLNSVMAALGVRSAGHAQQPDVDALKAAKFANLVAGSHGAKLAAAAGIDASHIKITKGGGGRVEPRISAPDAKKLADTLGVKTFYHDWKMNDDAETETEKVIDAIKMGMPNMLTTNRWSEGINQAGMSSTTDILTGGADYVFTRQSDQTPGNLRNGGGGIRLVYDAPKMLQRPDMFAYGSDSYGQARGVMYKDRDSLRNVQYGANNGGSQETMFKGRMSNDDLAAVYLPNKTLAAHAITELKAAGITTIGGKPIEDVVKSGSSY